MDVRWMLGVVALAMGPSACGFGGRSGAEPPPAEGAKNARSGAETPPADGARNAQSDAELPPAATAPAPVPAPSQTGSGVVFLDADEPDAPCTPMKGPVRLNFDDEPIARVIRVASRWSCRNFTFTNEVAKGAISVVSKVPVSTDEAYAMLGAALHANNIAMYRSGKYYNLVRVSDAKKTPIPTLIHDWDRTPRTEQPVTRVVRLRYAEADPLRKIIANFLSPSGSDIQAIPPDLLIITDIGLNLVRVERLIREIDQPGRQGRRWPEPADDSLAATGEGGEGR